MPKGKQKELVKEKVIASPALSATEEKPLDPDLILGDEPAVPVVDEATETTEETDEDTLETYEDDEVNPFGDKWEE